ncbi:hypothetical protein [Lentzea sp. NBRC 102530]|nr:hypothetical protein [Lentzea sp. NBRC 102530]
MLRPRGHLVAVRRSPNRREQAVAAPGTPGIPITELIAYRNTA